MIASKLKNDLRHSIFAGHNPFETYKSFAGRYGLSTSYCRSWANRPVLNTVAAGLKNDPQIGIDLTFLIRSGTTGYPSVIDGQPYNKTDKSQKIRARVVADQIIQKFNLNFPNPYP